MDNKISINSRLLNNSHDENYMPYPNLDYKYGPYKSLAEAKSLIDSNSRSIGLTIGVIIDNSITEYWWKSGIEDKDLVFKINNNSGGQQGPQGPQGPKGEDGKDGENGISVTHVWDGTTLIITSASGTSSANLKGEKGDRGEKGEQGERGEQGPQGLQGIQGEKGADGAKGDKGDKGDKGEQGVTGKDGVNGKDGADGKTPVKGEDYFTDEDKQELIANIKAEIGEDIPIVVLPTDTIEIEPNKLYLWDIVESLTITLATPTNENIVNEYMIQFTSGDIATQLTLPYTITWMSEPTINPNATYQISIINNLAVIGEFVL